MSCPRWDRLVAHRYEGPEGREPEGWQAALEHLDSCAECRKAAVAADPSLAFRRLPEISLGADELRSLRSGVDALRRARRIEASGLGGAEADRFPGRRLRSLRRSVRALRAAAPAAGRLAAAALLAGALLSVHPDQLAVDTGQSVGPAPTADVDAVLADDDIQSPTASVYHLGDDALAITMVVDPDLDV